MQDDHSAERTAAKIFRDPHAERFQSMVNSRIKDFRTLKQLEQTLQKQTPRIQIREESQGR